MSLEFMADFVDLLRRLLKRTLQQQQSNQKGYVISTMQWYCAR